MNSQQQPSNAHRSATLSRMAASIVGQLPEDLNEAHAVLDHARRLLQTPLEPRSGNVRAIS